MQLLFFVDIDNHELIMKRKEGKDDAIIESHFSLSNRGKKDVIKVVDEYLIQLLDYYYPEKDENEVLNFEE